MNHFNCHLHYFSFLTTIKPYPLDLCYIYLYYSYNTADSIMYYNCSTRFLHTFFAIICSSLLCYSLVQVKICIYNTNKQYMHYAAVNRKTFPCISLHIEKLFIQISVIL